MGDLSYRDTPYKPIVATGSVLGDVGAVVALVLASTWCTFGSNNNGLHVAATWFRPPRGTNFMCTAAGYHYV